ncbi:MAG: hypothetical protein KDD70_01460 [Bdellovibrionales bacterium]|nr:hypothetical protein [Bdellovibrionales bacterium]
MVCDIVLPMVKEKKVNISLEEALLRYLQLLDNQIAREMQRTPSEREVSGVQKWEPIQKRVEHVASLTIEGYGSEIVQLDSLIVTAEAFARTIRILAEELGEDGLGKTRSSYVRETAKNIERDLLLIKDQLSGRRDDVVN